MERALSAFCITSCYFQTMARARAEVDHHKLIDGKWFCCADDWILSYSRPALSDNSTSSWPRRSVSGLRSTQSHLTRSTS